MAESETLNLLKNKVLKIFGFLFLIRLGLYIPVPNVDLDIFSQTEGTNPLFGIAKNLNVEGDVVARTFKNTDVGIPTLESSSNLNLSAKNSIVVNIDGVEEGRITSDGINLRIIDTTINDTPIGNSGPSTGTFTEVTLKNNGTAPDNAVQKSYVDSGDIVFSIAFGA